MSTGLPERFSHHVSSFSTHTGQHVAVGIERYSDGGVPEQFLDELWVDIPLEQERRAGIAQVVECDLKQPCPLQEWRERTLAKVGWVDEAATLACEDEALNLVEATGLSFSTACLTW